MRSTLDTLDYAAGVVVRTFLLPLTVVMGFGWMIVGFIGPWLLAIYLVALVIDYLLSTSVDAGWRLLDFLHRCPGTVWVYVLPPT